MRVRLRTTACALLVLGAAGGLRLGAVVGKAVVLLGLGRPESRARRLGGGRRARTARLVAAVEHKVLSPLLTA